MKVLKVSLLLLLALLLMGATAQIVTDKVVSGTPGINLIQKKVLTVTSDSSGVVSYVTRVDGTVMRWTINPAADALAPTTLYDVTLLDSDNVDVLGGQGANLSATATTTGWTSVADASGNAMPISTAGNHTLAASNMGDAKQFVLTLYIK